MKIEEMWESLGTDSFEIGKEVNKYLMWLEHGREKTMDAKAVENAMEYLGFLGMHSTGLKDCIALEGLLESKTRRNARETELLGKVREYRGQATEELTLWAYNDLGIIAFEKEMYTAAKEVFKVAAELAENNRAINYNAGLACQAAGDLAGARWYYRKALDEGKLPAVLNNLGTLQIAIGNISDAKNTLDDALKLCPEDPDLLLNLGLFSEKYGNPRDTIQYFKQLLDIMPERPEIKYFLAKEYQKIGNIQDARKYKIEFIAQTMKK
jgi:Flp pilus assembly protein TadD